MNCCLLSVIFTCLFGLCFSWENRSSNVVKWNLKRPKRIVDGDKFRNRKEVPYKVVEYYVWIGNANSCHEDFPWWRSLSDAASAIYSLVTGCQAKKEQIHCGGSLIAPKIVQTAGHCLSTLVITEKDKRTPDNLWKPAVLKNHYESRMKIYMGAIDVADFRYPILSQKFAIHEKCSQFSLAPGCIRYDFGWIILELEVPWQEGVLFGTWGQLDYAGPFHKQEVATVYEQVIGQQHVCLLVGFGANELGLASRHMRQTWVQFLTWEQCYQAMYKIWKSSQYYTYNDSATWICAQQLPEQSFNVFKGRSGEGDSGTPVTCSNNYVALVTGWLHFGKKRRVGFSEMMMQSAITYIPEANSVEMRKDWEYELLRRPPRTELRTLRIPSGKVLKHPGFKNPELKKGSVSFPVIP